MRTIIAFVLILLATPAMAQWAGWTPYENGRFGYELMVPPDFEPDGPPPTNDDGRVFTRHDGAQLLRVYGGNIIEGNFESAVEGAMAAAEEAGWDLSYKRTTRTWASYSGTRGDMILYARGIALCGGTQYASFELEYPHADLERMNLTVEKLVSTLKATGNGVGC